MLLSFSNNILSLHMTIKELEKEKQIKTSLFKITHEIKNPLAVCKGYLDMFDVNNKYHATKYIPIIREEVDRTLVILGDFLEISKIKIEKDIMDINYLLDEVVESIKTLLKNKRIELIYESYDEVFIMGDFNRLKQVIINIIKNSIEAISEDGIIKISEKVEKNINISIEDNGYGMDDETLKKVKEAFFTTKKKGSGMGVYLSNEIIMAHQGTLKYESKENIGTTVNIILPLYKN